MVDGIAPREASDRLSIYQAKFDELWRKYQTYSGGEELFGLEVTEYPDLQRWEYFLYKIWSIEWEAYYLVFDLTYFCHISRIRKELNLLQKLYSLYNDVLEKVNGYYDIPWLEIDIETSNKNTIPH